MELFNAGKPWSEKDVECLIKNFKNMSRDSLVEKLGRSWQSIRTKYYDSYKREKGHKEKKVDLTICPNCDSKRVNRVSNNSYRTYFCIDCLLEYNKYGAIRPIWE